MQLSAMFVSMWMMAEYIDKILTRCESEPPVLGILGDVLALCLFRS